MVQIELQKSQIRQKKYYDRNTKVRTFEKGDEVLVLLPTNSNKLLLQWKGPFEMLERVRADDYRVQLVGRTKVFHANMECPTFPQLKHLGVSSQFLLM